MAPTFRITFSRLRRSAARLGEFPNAVVHHVDLRRVHAQQGDHLAPGEFRDRDHGIGARGRVARLGGKAGAELGRGVLAGHHEEIVEGGDGAAHRDAGQALVQAVEEVGAARSQRFGQHAPPHVRRQRGAPRAQIAMRPVAEIEAHLRDARAARPIRISCEYSPTPESASPML